jgi:hypothetical protein
VRLSFEKGGWKLRTMTGGFGVDELLASPR